MCYNFIVHQLTNFFWHKKNVHACVFDSLFGRSYAEGIRSTSYSVLRYSSQIFKLCLCTTVPHRKLPVQCSFIVHQSGQLTPAFTAS